MNAPKWTEADEATLAAMIGKYTVSQIADKIGRTRKSVWSKTCYLRRAGLLPKVQRSYTTKCSYKRALAPEYWTEAEWLLQRLLEMREYAARTGRRARVNLELLGEAMRSRHETMI